MELPVRNRKTFGLGPVDLASKLVEQAAYELVRNTPSDQVLPLFTIAARLEKEAKRILDNAT